MKLNATVLKSIAARAVRRGWRILGLTSRPSADAVRRQVASRTIGRANAARDAGRHRDAAVLYSEALQLVPANGPIHVQAGHMFKETGDLAAAEQAYLAGLALSPNDPEIVLQLGHFYKIAGKRESAIHYYRQASTLRPGWGEAARELAAMAGSSSAVPLEPTAFDHAGLAPELFPETAWAKRDTAVDGLHIRRLGRSERTPWGMWPTLRGVEGVRGVFLSSHPEARLKISMDGVVVADELLATGETTGGKHKHVFNIWIDFTTDVVARRQLDMTVFAGGESVWQEAFVIVTAPALTERDHPDSDAVIDLGSHVDRSSPQAVRQEINGRASVVRRATQAPFATPPANVLVMRTDQLGDMVTSVPAVRRLRGLLPNAKLVALVTTANAEFARTLGLFDETLVVDFPDDANLRQRVMSGGAQDALRERLRPYRFDVAIDLAQSHMSRPLLLLSGAPFLYGFDDGSTTWLTADFNANVRDPKNQLETSPQSAKVLALVERFGTLLSSGAEILRRTDIDRKSTALPELADDDAYLVIHAGARIAFSRWPHYEALIERILEDTTYKVVVFGGKALFSGGLSGSAKRHGRVISIDRQLDFDQFDAILSYSSAFVGNDSGPKHLASLRGVPVISLHSARINWNEWGQELSGCIISRKVPCAGCALYNEPDECGQDFACIRLISVDEVYQALVAELGGAGVTPAGLASHHPGA